jgi:hypothetical protein
MCIGKALAAPFALQNKLLDKVGLPKDPFSSATVNALTDNKKPKRPSTQGTLMTAPPTAPSMMPRNTLLGG